MPKISTKAKKSNSTKKPTNKKSLAQSNQDQSIDDLISDIQSDINDDSEPDALDLVDEEMSEFEALQNDRDLVAEIADDSVKLYLHEIGKTPLLTLEEEQELAREIIKYAPPKPKKKRKTKLVDEEAEESDTETDHVSEPEEDLVDRRTDQEKKKYDKAVSKMAGANMRLVVSIAKRYSGRGLDFLDLIQEGNTGLLRAIRKFDPDKGFKFSTYATWWIRQAITRAIADQARTIRIPVHMVETINRLLRTQRRMTQELNREPSLKELSKELKMDVEKVEHIMKIKQDITSLDATIGKDGDEDSALGDFVEDKDNESPEESAANQLLKELIQDHLVILSEREQKILKMRFGLGQNKSYTLEEVGREFDVTRERIRQIEAKALAKMRKHKDSKKLKAYLQ